MSRRSRDLATQNFKRCSTFSRTEDLLPFPLYPEPIKAEIKLFTTSAREEPVSPELIQEAAKDWRVWPIKRVAISPVRRLLRAVGVVITQSFLPHIGWKHHSVSTLNQFLMLQSSFSKKKRMPRTIPHSGICTFQQSDGWSCPWCVFSAAVVVEPCTSVQRVHFASGALGAHRDDGQGGLRTRT